MQYIFALLIFVTGCTHLTDIYQRLKPREIPKTEKVCKLPTTTNLNSTDFLVFGDSLGSETEKNFTKVKAAMLTKNVKHGLYLGDVYPEGVKNEPEYKKWVYDALKPIITIFSVGNHDRDGEGTINMIEHKDHIIFPCSYYGVTTPHYSIFVFDTNILDEKQLKEAEAFLCTNKYLVEICKSLIVPAQTIS